VRLHLEVVDDDLVEPGVPDEFGKEHRELFLAVGGDVEAVVDPGLKLILGLRHFQRRALEHEIGKVNGLGCEVALGHGKCRHEGRRRGEDQIAKHLKLLVWFIFLGSMGSARETAGAPPGSECSNRAREASICLRRCST